MFYAGCALLAHPARKPSPRITRGPALCCDGALGSGLWRICLSHGPIATRSHAEVALGNQEVGHLSHAGAPGTQYEHGADQTTHAISFHAPATQARERRRVERALELESRMLSRIDHPHIVGFRAAQRCADGRLGLVLEACECSLYGLIQVTSTHAAASPGLPPQAARIPRPTGAAIRAGMCTAPIFPSRRGCDGLARNCARAGAPPSRDAPFAR